MVEGGTYVAQKSGTQYPLGGKLDAPAVAHELRFYCGLRDLREHAMHSFDLLLQAAGIEPTRGGTRRGGSRVGGGGACRRGCPEVAVDQVGDHQQRGGLGEDRGFIFSHYCDGSWSSGGRLTGVVVGG